MRLVSRSPYDASPRDGEFFHDFWWPAGPWRQDLSCAGLQPRPANSLLTYFRRLRPIIEAYTHDETPAGPALCRARHTQKPGVRGRCHTDPGARGRREFGDLHPDQCRPAAAPAVSRSRSPGSGLGRHQPVRRSGQPARHGQLHGMARAQSRLPADGRPRRAVLHANRRRRAAGHPRQYRHRQPVLHVGDPAARSAAGSATTRTIPARPRP